MNLYAYIEEVHAITQIQIILEVDSLQVNRSLLLYLTKVPTSRSLM